MGNDEMKFAAKYNDKGCFAYKDGPYAGVAFYGVGGTRDEMKKDPESLAILSQKYRPVGYDCKTSCRLFLFIFVKILLSELSLSNDFCEMSKM